MKLKMTLRKYGLQISKVIRLLIHVTINKSYHQYYIQLLYVCSHLDGKNKFTAP